MQLHLSVFLFTQPSPTVSLALHRSEGNGLVWKCWAAVQMLWLPERALKWRLISSSASEDLHHQGNRSHRRGQQEQLGGVVRHHHQREEPASAVGEGQLQRGRTGEHRPGHPHCGTLGRGCDIGFIHNFIARGPWVPEGMRDGNVAGSILMQTGRGGKKGQALVTPFPPMGHV